MPQLPRSDRFPSEFDKLKCYFIEDLSLGMRACVEKTISEQDINGFAALSGDTNPLHLDEDYAGNTRFKGRIAHGMLTASLFSRLLGTELPGAGGVYLKQDLQFVAPVRIDDTVTAEVVISDINSEDSRVLCQTSAHVDGREVLKGQALLWVPSRRYEAA